MSNVIPLAARPTTEAGKRALELAKSHRQTAKLWLLNEFSASQSEWTRTQAMAVLRAWLDDEPLTVDAARWLNIMCASDNRRAKVAALQIRADVCGL